jgi:hypothetical protein
MKETLKSLKAVQMELKAPKSQFNSFGKYKYRSCEDILEAAKPLCIKHDLLLMLSDDVVNVGASNYVKATARIIGVDGEFSTDAFARESVTKKGQDDSQITGTASSYARKYALNGLFCIDDTKDADTDEHTARNKINNPVESESITPAQIKQLRAIADGMKRENPDGWKYITDKLSKGLTEQEAQNLINRGSKG